MTPTPTLTSLLSAVSSDQAAITAQTVIITNDANAVATHQGAVNDATAALATANSGLSDAQTQYNTDTAAVLPEFLKLQADVNAVVSFLQAASAPPALPAVVTPS